MERKPFYTIEDLPALKAEQRNWIVNNVGNVQPDNSKLYAGAPMTFLCTDCKGFIYAQEEYVNRNFQCDVCLWVRFLDTQTGNQ